MKKEEFINPAVTIDNIIVRFSTRNKQLEVLTIQRNFDPFYEENSLIGGFVKGNEHPNEAIQRILNQKLGTNITGLDEMLPVYYSKERDPRGWIFTIPNIILVKEDTPIPVKHKWISITDILDNKVKLAFDHNEIVNLVKKELYKKVENYMQFDILKQLLPDTFTSVQLEQILNQLEYKENKGILKNMSNPKANILRFFKKNTNSFIIEKTAKNKKTNNRGRQLSYFYFKKNN